MGAPAASAAQGSFLAFILELFGAKFVARWEKWYERLAARKLKSRPVLVSLLPPEHRANDYSVGECQREFEARGYLLERREYVKGVHLCWGNEWSHPIASAFLLADRPG